MKIKHQILFILLCLMSLSGNAQIIKTKLDIPIGFGYPEYVHAGLRYQYGDVTQAGIFMGGDMGVKNEIIRTFTLDHMIHFGNIYYKSNRPGWYARQAFTYSVNTDAVMEYKLSYLHLGLGHDFPINNVVGINTDMGMMLQVREKYQFKDGSSPATARTNWAWNYQFRIQLYISL